MLPVTTPETVTVIAELDGSVLVSFARNAVLNVVPLPMNVTAVLLRASGPVTVARTVWAPGKGFASPHCSTRTLDPGDAD